MPEVEFKKGKLQDMTTFSSGAVGADIGVTARGKHAIFWKFIAREWAKI